VLVASLDPPAPGLAAVTAVTQWNPSRAIPEPTLVAAMIRLMVYLRGAGETRSAPSAQHVLRLGQECLGGPSAISASRTRTGIASWTGASY
jgi:hypothetical protein